MHIRRWIVLWSVLVWSGLTFDLKLLKTKNTIMTFLYTRFSFLLVWFSLCADYHKIFRRQIKFIGIMKFGALMLENSLSIQLKIHLLTKVSIDKLLLIGIHFLIYHWKLPRFITFYVTFAITAWIKIQLSRLEIPLIILPRNMFYLQTQPQTLMWENGDSTIILMIGMLPYGWWGFGAHTK